MYVIIYNIIYIKYYYSIYILYLIHEDIQFTAIEEATIASPICLINL